MQSKSEYEELNCRIRELKAEHAANIQEIEEKHKDAMRRAEEAMNRDAKVSCEVKSSHQQVCLLLPAQTGRIEH